MSNATDVTDDSFEQEVLKSAQPVLVDFWAPWCGPCRQLAHTIDQIAGDYAGKVKVVKVNVDDHQQIASRFGVRGIPALHLFKNGELVANIVGAVPKGQITKVLDEHI